MQHHGPVTGAKFSQDESHILTWSADGTARLWRLPQIGPWPIEKLPLHYQVRTGTRLKDGKLEHIPPEEWLVMKSEYDQIARDLAQAQAP
ncbi:MAG: hypothetical protein Tsb0020_01390 [Haliangiales bacterium]